MLLSPPSPANGSALGRMPAAVCELGEITRAASGSSLECGERDDRSISWGLRGPLKPESGAPEGAIYLLIFQ